MTSLISNIKIYLKNNGKNYDNEYNNISVDGDSKTGISIIKEWEVSGLVKPTDKQLSDLDNDAIDLEAEEAVIVNRKREYPALGQQLDLLFHDMTAGKGTKSGEWYKAIAKVKADNPKG